MSGFSQVAGPVTATINNWVNPHVNSWNQVDLNISRNFTLDGADMTGYFVVQNFLNAQPAYVPNGTIGQWYPVYTSGYSVQSPMGRYFTSASAPIYDRFCYSCGTTSNAIVVRNGGRMKRHCPVPHIGWKQHQPSRHRLDGASHRIAQRDRHRRLAEFDPALFCVRVLGHVGHGDIIAGADPALRVQMVFVKALIAHQ